MNLTLPRPDVIILSMTKKKHVPLESTISNSIIKYLESIKSCHAVKIHGSVKKRNNPDIFCVIRGTPIVIEVKRPEGNYGVTPGQLLELIRWKKAGAATMTATGVKQVRDKVNALCLASRL